MNNLVTTFGSENFDDVAALTGAFVPGNTLLPSVKLNRNAEDDDRNAVPVGTYFVSQNGITIYGPSVKFRVFLNTYQYMIWDETTKKFTNKSIIIKNFNEQAIDELGGVRCGKLPAKEFVELSEKGLLSEKEIVAQKAIKCYRGMYGLISFDGITQLGKKTTIENLPVIWRMAGKNFNAPKQSLDAITKVRHLWFQHWLKFGKLEREKQGSNVYYIINQVEPVLNEELEFSTDDMGTFTMFQELIDKENAGVAEKWRTSKKSVETDIVDIAAELDLNDSLEDL